MENDEKSCSFGCELFAATQTKIYEWSSKKDLLFKRIGAVFMEKFVFITNTSCIYTFVLI